MDAHEYLENLLNLKKSKPHGTKYNDASHFPFIGPNFGKRLGLLKDEFWVKYLEEHVHLKYRSSLRGKLIAYAKRRVRKFLQKPKNYWAKGRIVVNNGLRSRMVDKDNIPEGYVIGRLPEHTEKCRLAGYHDEERKKYISKRTKEGMKASGASAKITKAQKGLRHSLEHKKKTSETMKKRHAEGRFKNVQYKKPWLGKSLPDAMKKKISNTVKKRYAMKKHTKIYYSWFKHNTNDVVLCEIMGLKAVDIHHIFCKGMGGSKEKDYIENLMASTREVHLTYGDKKQYIDWLIDVHFRFMGDGVPQIHHDPFDPMLDVLFAYPTLKKVILWKRQQSN